MRGEYETWLAEDLSRLRQCCAELAAAAPAMQDERRAAAARLAHDIKGQGASFGYQLITDIAMSLHHYLVRVPAAQQRAAVVAAHLEALDAVARLKICGDGGAIGAAIVDTLAKALRSPPGGTQA
jgi:hypothetical protein